MNLQYLIPFYDPTVKDWSLSARLLRWLTFLWLAIGIFVLFSASDYYGEVGKMDILYSATRQLFSLETVRQLLEQPIVRQIVALFISLIFFNAIVHSPLRKSIKTAPWFLIIFLGLLLLTVFTGLGKNTMGATRWIGIGPIQLQPSEPLKPFLVLQAANLFGRWEQHPHQYRIFWLGIFAIVLLAILKQPNLSTTSLCAIGLWSIAFVAGLPIRPLLLTAVGGAIVAGLSMTINTYQRVRVLSFINPWADPQGDSFQLVQSLLAIGSGGIFGNGFGLSQQKLGYLPIKETDFIFSVFAEEFGLIGCVLLLSLVMCYATLGMTIAHRCQHRVHRSVAVGATMFIVLQALFNIGVATGVLPTTGLPLPMFSYGGSSLAASLILSALLIRVARESATAPVVTLRKEQERAVRN